jgi:hypothetical protein
MPDSLEIPRNFLSLGLSPLHCRKSAKFLGERGSPGWDVHVLTGVIAADYRRGHAA